MTPTEPAAVAPSWSFPQRFLFRFAFTFFWLFGWLGMFFPLQAVQSVTSFAVAWNDSLEAQHAAAWQSFFTKYQFVLDAWNSCVAKFGERILGLVETVDVSRSGSGDKIEDLSQIVLIASISFVVACLWSLVSRRRAHPRLGHWLWIGARFFLAGTMLGYGFAKVIKTQFSEPSLSALTTPLGDLAPMTLVWTFMGFSTPYTIFAGAGEVVGGLLLAFRRTATLGALVAFGVMLNVTLLNYCYDVPVKFYATYYLVLAILISLPDARRLLDVLVFQRAVPARSLAGPSRHALLNHSLTGLALLWITAVTQLNISSALTRYRQSGDGRTKPALYGVYEVTRFVRNGETIPPRLDDDQRWQRIIIDYPLTASIVTPSGKYLPHSLNSYPASATIELQPIPTFSRTTERFPKFLAAQKSPFPDFRALFTIRETAPKEYVFAGRYLGATLEVTLKRRLREDFELTGRGFHWLNPLPYQRLRRG